ncbi:family 78 glycoside hydrolase catalytic domain [Arthrobacter sp. 2MCAF15]|uniref:alpha-L-rhamnosidase n=1 Tax=Arthrobacter sp. 2MCAF15 TaxID=3232984 RepID=UPI003F8E2508
MRFIKDFTVDGKIARAVLTLTAHGAYEAQIDGQPVGDHAIAPGWTTYHSRLLSQSFDVTRHLGAGSGHRLGMTVAAGWFGETYGYFGRGSRAYQGPLGVVANLHLSLTDGREIDVPTDGSWFATSRTPILSSGIYNGEAFDARLEIPGWSNHDTQLPELAPATVTQRPQDYVRPETAPPVRRTQYLDAVASTPGPEKGSFILDFGQNIAGRVELRVQGERGTEVTLRHAEVLENGELATRPLRNAAQTDRYILAGTGEEIWEPSFTYHGFRFVEVKGWPDVHPEQGIRAVACGSDLKRTGSWKSSSALLDKFHENVVWSARANFFSIPTDCTQRDERLGWTGDIAAFVDAASYLFDVAGHLSSWLEDLAIGQAAECGNTPLIVPAVLPPFPSPIAGWGDATTIVPWALFENFADTSVLERQFESMRLWVDTVLKYADEDLAWSTGGQIGDHLDPTAPPDRPTEAKAAKEVVASAYLARSLRLVARTAAVLGKRALADEYGDLADRSATSFARHYVSPAGRIMSDSQTAYAMAIAFELAPNTATRKTFGRRLAELVRENGYHVGTGFLGTPFLLGSLLKDGHHYQASRLLNQTENPSWLYPVTMGATSVWERWDSLLPDGSINPGEMVSFNHYAFGSVAHTLYAGVAGLAPAKPGWARISFHPQPLEGLDYVDATVETPYGHAKSGWSREDGKIRVNVTVPPNTSGYLTLPDGSAKVELSAGSHQFVIDAEEKVRPLALDRIRTDLAAIMDDEAAHRTLVEAVGRADEGYHRRLTQHTQWKRNEYISEALMFAPASVTKAIDEAFSEMNSARGL